MDFDIDVCRAVGAPSREDGRPTVVRIQDEAFRHPRWGEGLRKVLDGIGERSRRAQGLGKAVTYGSGNVLGSCRVYLLAHRSTVFGVLKVGPKRLFVAKGADEGLVEINPQCVLDFYVVEGHQRGGFGATLFRAMLAREGIRPDKFAYDRPSPKLLAFLRKHFGLARFQAQSNNFVVFDAYFAAPSQGGGPPSALKPRSGASAQPSSIGPGSAGGNSARRRAPSAPLLGPRFHPCEEVVEASEAVGLAAAHALGVGGAAAAGGIDELVVGPSMRRAGPACPQAKLSPRKPPAAMPTAQGMAPQQRPPLAGGRAAPSSGSSGGMPPTDPARRRGCPPGATGGNPLRNGEAGGRLLPRRTARSASPLAQAAKSSLAAPSPLVQAMAAGLQF